jgi:N-acetylneuraminic acid mutarotase
MTNQAFALQLATGDLGEIPSYPTSSLFVGTAVACANRLWVFGGASWNVKTRELVNHATSFSYTPATRAWTPIASLPQPNRGITAVTLDERYIFLGGGYATDTGFTAESFVYDTKENSYRPSIPMPYGGMVSLIKYSDHVYCLGGEDAPRHRSAAVHRIKLSCL